MELDLPELPVHPDRFTFEDTHEWTRPSHTAFHLDIHALEMLSVDQLVDRIYEDRLIKQDIQGFVTRVPVFCSAEAIDVLEVDSDDVVGVLMIV
jgi:hypothetical protein